jgi:hypothetical protein
MPATGRELCRDLVIRVARERAAGTDGVLSRAVDVQIDLSHQRVIAAMDRRIEPEAAEIQATVFAEGRIVTPWI